VLDLQKLTLGRLLETQNNDFYSKLQSEYFSGMNAVLYDKVKTFYKANLKLPSVEELLLVHKDIALQDYLETQILVEENRFDKISDGFLVSQLQDYYVRDETIKFLDKFMGGFENLEKVEVIDQLQNLVLDLSKAGSSQDELFDVGELDFFPKNDDFVLYPSGLSHEYDSINGGFALQELVLLGGRRGSGKSIISLNCAYTRFKQGSTVAFFSIEMRYKEVYDRLLSIISDVPFLDIYTNKLSDTQKIQIIKSKVREFYKDTPELKRLVEEAETSRNFAKFELEIKNYKHMMKDHRFFIIDDESLTISRIDHHCNRFASNYPNFTLAVIDYINIIKAPDQKDWKTQITLSETVKGMARKYNITALSPYQIDASGEARYAKGLLDSADRSFIFMPPDLDKDPNLIKIMTSKIRNGKALNFDVTMDWQCVRVNANQSRLINEKLLPAEKYGSESSKDI
jgi:replicative DNA helicase